MVGRSRRTWAAGLIFAAPALEGFRDAILAVPLANFLNGILALDLGNGLDAIFFFAVENFLDGIFAISITKNRDHEKWPAAQKSGEPVFSGRNAVGRHHVQGLVFDPRDWLRFVSFVLRQHQRQDVRNVPHVAGAITKVISYGQALEHGNLPRTTFVSPATRILASSVRLSTRSVFG